MQTLMVLDLVAAPPQVFMERTALKALPICHQLVVLDHPIETNVESLRFLRFGCVYLNFVQISSFVVVSSISEAQITDEEQRFVSFV
jgi:hypothetical protein